MWVKHPTSSEDGEITIAGPQGLITRQMVSGVFDWPDGLPLHSAYKPAIAPPELIRAQREADVSRLREEAAKLGFQLFAPESEPTDSEPTDEDPEAEKAAVAAKPKASSRSRSTAAKE